MSRRIFFKKLLAFMLCVILMVLPLANIYAADATGNGIRCKTKSKDNSINSEFYGDNFKVNFTVESKWDGAFNGNIVIQNISDSDIHN